MRFLVRATASTPLLNQKIKDGTFPHIIENVLGFLKPEATYFTAENGNRTIYLVISLNDASEIPKLGETLFHAFEAKVEMMPIMLPEDLMKAGPHMAEAVKLFAN